MRPMLYLSLLHYSRLPPSYSSVNSWFNELNCDRRSLKDEIRESRPITDVVSENIDVVRELIMQDRHVAYRQIKAFNIS